MVADWGWGTEPQGRTILGAPGGEDKAQGGRAGSEGIPLRRSCLPRRPAE